MIEVSKLNAQQKKAVLHNKGPMLVVAGAGTGKTAVISMRIAHLILKRGISADTILALTFTEKAAAEMQDRVDELLPYGYVDTEISTFHALGDKILREHGFAIGLQSDFVVMSSFQQVIMMQRVVNGMLLKYYKSLGSPYSFVRGLVQIVSRLKDENIDANAYARFIKRFQADQQNSSDEVQRVKELGRIYTKYQKLCGESGMIDYGDQIMLTISLLRKRPSVLRSYHQTYEYILVDEYQDTNSAQNILIKMLSNKHHNIMAVGDDDQSIYRFRGAAISNIIHFTQDFPDVTQVVLTKNYRSTQKILNDSYRLIQHNNPYRLEAENGLDKKLVGTRGKSQVNVVVKTTIVEEMEYVADAIMKLVKIEGLKYSDIAILLRKNNQAKEIAHSLQRQGIPFVVAESQSLFEQAEIKVLMYFVHIINDPNASDALYGFLASDLLQMPLENIAQHSSLAMRSRVSLEHFLRDSGRDEEKGLSPQVELALGMIDKFRAAATDISAGQLLYQFIESSGYLTRLVDEAEKSSVAVQKVQNISQFFAIVRDFEIVASQNPHIFAFWNYMREINQSEMDILVQPSPLDTDAVSVMTIHKAKGLEFEAVFMIDLAEQTFPARNMSDKIPLPRGILSEMDSKIPWHIHEERRLFYVGMTRAKSYLCMTTSFDHGGKRLKKPSRFIMEATDKQLVLPKSKKLAQLETIKTFAQLEHSHVPSPIAKYITEDGWLHLSTNQIADYLRSPKEFWYFDVLSLPKGPFHALVYGSAIHAAIELYYRAKLNMQSVELGDLLQSFENSWNSEGFVSLQHEKERFDSGRKTLTRFYNREEKRKDIPRYVEKPFILKIETLKLKISGRYDAVYVRKNAVEIRDFKTGGVDSSDKAQQRLKDSLQMKIYALAWERTHQSPASKVSLYFVEKHILASSSKIDHTMTLELLKKVAEGIRRQKFAENGSSQIRFGGLL